MNRFLSILAVLLVGIVQVTVAADVDGRLSGKIQTQEGYPVAFANIYLEELKASTFTNDRGEFQISNIKPGDYMLRITAVGFVTLRQSVEIKANEELKLALKFEEDVQSMPQITVIASRDRLFSKTPGSVGYVSKKELQQLNPLTANEALRRVAGVHVVDEELAGMRLNVGIRGLNPDRSRQVLVLEDGVPVALNPYGEPEMYYSPAIDRMAGVEVLKGSGQVLHGPQTVGGVINYVTADPSEQESFQARFQGGQGGFFSGLLNYGNTVGNTGIQVNYLRKQASEMGATEFGINDFNMKIKQVFSEKSVLGVKLGFYNERSNATYVGLTQTMFDAGGQDFVRLAPDDALAVDRYSVSLHHDYKFNASTSLKSLAFAYRTTRNWRRQDFSFNPNAPNRTGVVWGNPDIPNGAIFMQSGTGNRNRQFEVAGFEQRLKHEYALAGKNSELIAGYRIMHEVGYEQRINGTKPDARSGALVTDEMRTGNAIALFAQNTWKASEKLSLNGGVRAEFYSFDREIMRNAFSGVVRDTSIVNNHYTGQIIPGVGFNYQASVQTALFGGVHVGYAPPRVKDAITAVGEVIDLDAESSVNYEIGLRSTALRGIFFELTAFHMDFSNQIIPVSESIGGTGAGLVNAGESRHSGFEAAMVVDIASLLGSKHQIEYDFSATYVTTAFTTDRYQSLAGEEINIRGNQLPYAPNFFLSSAFTWVTPAGLGVRMNGTYVSSQFGDQLNTIEPSANGRTGQIPAYFLLDTNIMYQPKGTNTSFNISAKNLLDQRYIVSRRPQGVRVGLPRFITAGVDFRF